MELKEHTLEWMIQSIEYEIDKAIRDYHRMKLSNLPFTEEEVERLLLMYIETSYGCIQTIEAGLEDVIS
jgi:hypothetical protein